MAIQQTNKQSDLEKRLRLLRQQVYGRESVAGSKQYDTTNYPLRSEASQLPTTDVTYLHQDLLKISLLASLALGAQIILFYLLKNNVLRINLL